MKHLLNKAALHACAKLRDLEHAVEAGGVGVSFVASILRQCGDAMTLEGGKRAHSLIVKCDHHRHTFVGNLLVQMYGNLGSIEDARAVFEAILRRNVFTWTIMLAAYAQNGHLSEAMNLFDKMPRRNVVSWTTMLKAYALKGQGKKALQVFGEMDLEGEEPDAVTFASMLDVCASLSALSIGKAIHDGIVDSGVESNVVVATALVDMYGKCKSVEDARMVFEKMLQRNVLSWTAMVAAYAQNGHLQLASQVFHKMPQRDVVSWNAMLAAFAQNGHPQEALHLFEVMKSEGLAPDNVTFISILDACARLADLAGGKAVHAAILRRGFESDVVVGNALANMYGKCEKLEDAKAAFDNMAGRNVVSWNGMITVYAQNGHNKEALELFKQMDIQGFTPDNVTFLCMLEVCANLTALAEGNIIYDIFVGSGFHLDPVVYTALVDLYGKCGCLDIASRVFENMPQNDVVSWNAMIAANALYGHPGEALVLLQRLNLQGLKPDKITFVSILSLCSRAGLWHAGWQYLLDLQRDYEIVPILEHYQCMVDLLGRAGRLDAAQDLINNMPFEPDVTAWKSLLGACKVHGELERATCVAKSILNLESKHSSVYVMLANTYRQSGLYIST